ncbi:MAG: tRNA preQ1(34) S-adenosylmethionine ribosyltransferase-isomerase QueA [Campylobacteraceae bacterium]|jgi:S-adenosylmethionine:tRNA ribosyltransferase-isomerase|nr:tRNA preQ1(34) S-adenosylmethionine ribosyltransferase-isomerase QueA [Campylobacteraceae bacterium]MBT7117196.1 tRNA preQ1(34) S-adenosylmethionine ribosyltransferase-isomerase QueA [Campylobacteraceae bacterium]MBT7273683.1 tRNA preQ1(34) S-adenosylmethionine ribosyltransferase-isomerase QueA [Campylobacteraceae bacterium]
MKVKRINPSLTSSYDFNLPQELIANHPVSPADTAKLLIYNRSTNTITHEIFKNIINYLPQNTSIFLNDTKVIKARIFGKKDTGGKVELLLNKHLPNNDTYLVYIKGKVHVGTKLYFEQDLEAEVVELVEDDGSRVVKFTQNNNHIPFQVLIEILNDIGHIPLPVYINREDEKCDETDYQTLFAKNYGAVAAPTASLHFTEELLDELKDKFETNYLTLHVGAGTFKPVDVEDITKHNMHSEYYDIPQKTQEALNNNSTKKLAVGTTATRTLEYYTRTKKVSGECDLFLNPDNQPQIVDILLTNFHLPKSTLIMLVASFVGLEKTLELYEEAIKNEYRFYSYGDAMLII